MKLSLLSLGFVITLGLTASCGGAVSPNEADRPDAATGVDAAAVGTWPGHPGSVTGEAGVDLPSGCTADERAEAWARMIKNPIAPPNVAGLLDLSTPGGLTLADATAILCQSTNLGDEFGDGEVVAAWGDDNEVQLVYDPSTQVGSEIVLFPIAGAGLECRSADAQSFYTLMLGDVITKNGMAFALGSPASSPSSDAGAAVAAAADELYRALMATFMPGLPPDPAGTTCLSTQTCVVTGGESLTYLYIPALGLGLSMTDQTPATLGRIEIHRVP